MSENRDIENGCKQNVAFHRAIPNFIVLNEIFQIVTFENKRKQRSSRRNRRKQTTS